MCDRYRIWVFGIDGGLTVSGLAAQRYSREPAAENCSNKRATWRLLMCLFAVDQAQTTHNAARSATLQAGGLHSTNG